MTPRLLPFFERAARFALHRRGFESRIIPTGVVPLHAFVAAGEGPLPTTVLLHGIGAAAITYAATLVRLRPHVRRLIALDLPGHGFSAAPEVRLTPEVLFGCVREALDRAADEPIILVGNSMGGALALHYAMEEPERVRALVLVSPAGARISPEEWGALVRSFKIESVAEARRLLGRLYHRTPWYAGALAPDFRAVLRRRAIRDLLETTTLEHFPDPRRFGELTMPVLLLWGQSERIMPLEALGYFRRYLPAHTLVEEPSGFGHCPHFDDPGRLAARIVDFARTAVPDTHREAS